MVFKMVAMAPIFFLFPIGRILAIFHLHVNLLLHHKFQLIHLMVCDVSKTYFKMAAVAAILDC